MKLSKPQIKMLEAIKTIPREFRERYVAYSSHNKYENRVSDIGFYAPFSGGTYRALFAKGLVAIETGEDWSFVFVLTPAGLAALEAEGAE